ncbi:MAG: S1C family serine protease [Acidimicrobiia bacterium]
MNRQPPPASEDLAAWSWTSTNRASEPGADPTEPLGPAGQSAPLPPPPTGRTAPSPPRPPSSNPPQHRGHHFLTGAIVGGLVGALVAAGVGVAIGTDDDGSSDGRSGTVAVGTDTNDKNRAANTIGKTGDIQAILDAVLPATVAVTADTSQGEAAGSGFVVTSDGYLVTNAHVVSGTDSALVVFTDGNEFTADVIGTDAAADIAVLKIDGENLPTATLGNSDDVVVGDAVVAVGNALALDGGPSVTSGIVSGLDRDLSAEGGGTLVDVLQTDAAISPGNSGGPLVDATGKVIGINTAIADPTTAENIGFVIPISHAVPIIDQLREGRAAAFLGVGTTAVTAPLAEEEGLSVDHGAYVEDVTFGSGADEVGIQVGDVIVEIDGVAIDSSGDVQAAVRSNAPGDSVPVTIVRGEETITLDATLGERPDQS